MVKKILFVDDEEQMLEMVRKYLTMAGYAVMTANSADDALMQTRGAKLDLIILDLKLADENGVVLMQFFRRTHPKVPIIFYSGMPHDPQAIRDLLKEGAFSFLPKGPLEDLLKAVKTALT